MLKLPYMANNSPAMPEQLEILRGKLGRLASAIRNFVPWSGDIAYKWQFTRKLMPEIYRVHISELVMNCAFCENLVRSSCHSQCMKCRAGTYIHCSPLLPAMLHYYEFGSTESDGAIIPWYYKNTCSRFKRLERKKYLRNFILPLSPMTIENLEVLEGLTRGLSAGEKPCRICACADYEIYKACTGQKDFEKSGPCDRIASLLASKYSA